MAKTMSLFCLSESRYNTYFPFLLDKRASLYLRFPAHHPLETLQEMLEGELDDSLGYEKNVAQDKKTTNRRNGHSKKTVRSEYGDVELEIPRDPDGEFEPLVVKKHQKNITDIEDQILALYAKGVSTREIQDHLDQLYGVDISPTLISNVTNKIMPLIIEWQK